MSNQRITPFFFTPRRRSSQKKGLVPPFPEVSVPQQLDGDQKIAKKKMRTGGIPMTSETTISIHVMVILVILPLVRVCYGKQINILPEALPAYENDQNYYVLTARSQFLHSKPIKKKGPSTLGMTTLPSLQPQKGQPQLFLTLKIIERSIKFMWKCQ